MSVPSAFRKFGVANMAIADAQTFVETILGLPSNSLIYQQALVRNNDNSDLTGPGTAAEYCGSIGFNSTSPNVLRQVSAVHNEWARRNLTKTGSPIPNYALLGTGAHGPTTTNQNYYLMNEPDGYHAIGASICNFGMPDTSIDSEYSVSPAPSGVTTFETAFGGYRFTAQALAYTYLKLWKYFYDPAYSGKGLQKPPGQQHLFIPPAATNARLGGVLTDDGFWRDFFAYLHTTGAGGLSPITPAQLKVLHLHRYAVVLPQQDTSGYVTNGYVPMTLTRQTINNIRIGTKWYRDTYVPGADIPCDLLISEAGPSFFLENPIYSAPRTDPGEQSIYLTGLMSDRVWSASYTDIWQGLQYWNSWLAWVALRSRVDNYLSSSNSAYHNIHIANKAPYVAPQKNSALIAPPPSTGPLYGKFTNTWKAAWSTRNQWFWHADVGNVYINYNADAVYCSGLASSPSGTLFTNKFTAFNDGTAPDYWRMPFGVCYTAWSRILYNQEQTGLGQWRQMTTAGQSLTDVVTLSAAAANEPTKPNAGYYTVLYALYKDIGSFNTQDRLTPFWTSAGSSNYFGNMFFWWNS